MYPASAIARVDRPETVTASDGLSVVIVCPGGIPPPLCVGYLDARVTADLADVRVADDVVILASRGAAALVARLVARFAVDTPPILVIAPTFDPDDARAALSQGATSYVLETECTRSLDWTVRQTAEGRNSLGSCAASLLIREVRTSRRPFRREDPHHGLAAGLSPREIQIMELIAEGHKPVEVASRLRLQVKTIRNNLSRVYAKLRVRGMTEAIIVWRSPPNASY